MAKLTIEKKQIIIGANYYMQEFNNYVDIDDDNAADDAPYNILERWLSEILDIDYRKDIYNNTTITELNRIEHVKQNLIAQFNMGWFIGDIVKDELYKLCNKNIQDPVSIGMTEDKIKEMWKFFVDVCSDYNINKFNKLPKEDEFEYVSTNFAYEGQVLYKKVKKV